MPSMPVNGNKSMWRWTLLALFAAGCNSIAPFDLRAAPPADGDSDVDGDSDFDHDDARSDSDVDADADTDADYDQEHDRDSELDSDGDDADDTGFDADGEDDSEQDACVPSCDERECGPDGCGHVCGPGCGGALSCDLRGRCVETPAAHLWIQIDAGVFRMGSPTGELGSGYRDCCEDEVVHEVELTHDFLLLSSEVTQSDFERLMGYNPSYFPDPREVELPCADGDCPVENLSWFEAAEFCNVLSRYERLQECYLCERGGGELFCEPSPRFSSPYLCPGYRLPTESEWEYAVRAGTTSATWLGELEGVFWTCDPQPALDPIAYWACNSERGTHRVAELLPNPWGLFDMLGNVAEWCHDWYAPYPTDSRSMDPFGPEDRPEFGHRTGRGGSGGLGSYRCRSAFRGSRDEPEGRNGYLGFRVARTHSP